MQRYENKKYIYLNVQIKYNFRKKNKVKNKIRCQKQRTPAMNFTLDLIQQRKRLNELEPRQWKSSKLKNKEEKRVAKTKQHQRLVEQCQMV